MLKAISNTLILGIGQMTYSVYQHWDPLRVCAVGRSYPPEFYSFITNSRVRAVMERIAQETEEDYQKLISVLEKFNVKIIRADLDQDLSKYRANDKGFRPNLMTPRDYTAMIGDKFFMPTPNLFNPLDKLTNRWDEIRGNFWPGQAPKSPEEFDAMPDWIKEELDQVYNITPAVYTDIIQDHRPLLPLETDVSAQGNEIIYNTGVSTATMVRMGRDLYFGTKAYDDDLPAVKEKYSAMFPNHRCHVINTGGHADGVLCAANPGLLISLRDVPDYANTFPDWEVVYLPNQSWNAIPQWLELKAKNRGKWWVPGEELNDEFTDYVEGWMNHWVGYVEESVFDVNMLVIDKKNIICNNYNEAVFKAFDRYGITPHIVNFRHRYFWDGGLHCITSDLHREGVMEDYFPERDLT